MSTKTSSFTYTLNEETLTKNYLYSFEGSTLTVSLEVTDENGDKKFVPALVQPWKCNPDGSREDFVNDEDAFDWADSVKGSLF